MRGLLGWGVSVDDVMAVVEHFWVGCCCCCYWGWRLTDLDAPPKPPIQERRPFEGRLVGLWLAYAGFERNLRQWKQVGACVRMSYAVC